jgi:hypothetical protein
MCQGWAIAKLSKPSKVGTAREYMNSLEAIDLEKLKPSVMYLSRAIALGQWIQQELEVPSLESPSQEILEEQPLTQA